MARFKDASQTLHNAKLEELEAKLQVLAHDAEFAKADPSQKTAHLLAAVDEVRDLWPGLSTKAQERAVAETLLDIVPATVRRLGSHQESLIGSDGVEVTFDVTDECVDFNVVDQLRVFLKHPSVQAAVKAYRTQYKGGNGSGAGSLDKQIASLYDGLYWQTHKLVKEYPEAYPLVVYQDGVCMTKLGSKRAALTVEITYIVLMELPAVMQGLECVMLLANLTWAADLKRYGHRCVFGGAGQVDSSLGHSLRTLGRGLFVELWGELCLLVAFMYTFLSDLPAGNGHSGHMISVGHTEFFCRYHAPSVDSWPLTLLMHSAHYSLFTLNVY